MILRGVMKAIKKNEEECKITITIEITIKDGKQIISNQEFQSRIAGRKIVTIIIKRSK